MHCLSKSISNAVIQHSNDFLFPAFKTLLSEADVTALRQELAGVKAVPKYQTAKNLMMNQDEQFANDINDFMSYALAVYLQWASIVPHEADIAHNEFLGSCMWQAACPREGFWSFSARLFPRNQ